MGSVIRLPAMGIGVEGGEYHLLSRNIQHFVIRRRVLMSKEASYKYCCIVLSIRRFIKVNGPQRPL